MQVKELDDLGEVLERLTSWDQQGKPVALLEEIRARIHGLRTDIVTLLETRDVHLIDSMDRFDPSRHRPIALQPRPAGLTGPGVVQRCGLVLRSDGKDRVLTPALVVLFDDRKEV